MSVWRDPSGKASMARLVAFLLACAAVAIAGAVAYVIVVGKSGGGAIGDVAAILATIISGGTVAILSRVRDRSGNG